MSAPLSIHALWNTQQSVGGCTCHVGARRLGLQCHSSSPLGMKNNNHASIGDGMVTTGSICIIYFLRVCED